MKYYMYIYVYTVYTPIGLLRYIIRRSILNKRRTRRPYVGPYLIYFPHRRYYQTVSVYSVDGNGLSLCQIDFIRYLFLR